MQNVVTRWFGPEFSRLHPLLQRLHQHGGNLHGTVAVQYGQGLAGWIGRRLATKLGIPTKAGDYPFEVRISHSEHALHWDRLFNHSSPMSSVFTPSGHYPHGVWRETTGLLNLELGVDIREGGWHWVQKKVRLGWLPIPLWLVPGSSASKHVENDRYVFQVAFFLPLTGKLLSYGGHLEANISHP